MGKDKKIESLIRFQYACGYFNPQGITLDLGCSRGESTKLFADLRKGLFVKGIEKLKTQIGHAKKNKTENNDFVCDDVINYLANCNDTIENIAALEIIDEIDDKELFLQLCNKVLKETGVFVISLIKKELLELVQKYFTIIPDIDSLHQENSVTYVCRKKN